MQRRYKETHSQNKRNATYIKNIHTKQVKYEKMMLVKTNRIKIHQLSSKTDIVGRNWFLEDGSFARTSATFIIV